MCEKVSFENKIDASSRAFIINMRNRKRRPFADKLRAYKCDHCGKYHLTSLSVKEYEYKVKKYSRVVNDK